MHIYASGSHHTASECMGPWPDRPRIHAGPSGHIPARTTGRARPPSTHPGMPDSQIYSIVLRDPQVGKFPAGLMPLIGPSLRRSPATFQTLGHVDLSNARSLLIAMSSLQSIAVMHPWVAAAWCRLYRTDASSASVQRVRADFAAALRDCVPLAFGVTDVCLVGQFGGAHCLPGLGRTDFRIVGDGDSCCRLPH